MPFSASMWAACRLVLAIQCCAPPFQVPNAECVACGVAPKEHCWPGKGFNATTDHACDCFATLGFCKPGESPVYPPAGTVGKAACPSCWPGDSNHACDCFAAIPFCGN